MPFSSRSILVWTGDGRNFSLARGFRYISNDGEVFDVPQHTTTDGASNIRLLWNLIPPFGKYWLPAVLHDFLYRCTSVAKGKCDDLFYEAMRSRGVNPFLAWVIYLGVKLGGGPAFDEDRRRLLNKTSLQTIR